MVEWLLDRGAVPAFLGGLPVSTALHTALRRGHLHIATTLLKAMESAAVIDSYGCTPLHILCMETQYQNTTEAAVNFALELVQKSCPLDALDHEGITALHHCVINDSPELTEMLLLHGAKPDALIPDTWVSPLTIAAIEKNMRIAELLMRYGADPYVKTREGQCPATIYKEIERQARLQ